MVMIDLITDPINIPPVTAMDGLDLSRFSSADNDQILTLN